MTHNRNLLDIEIIKDFMYKLLELASNKENSFARELLELYLIHINEVLYSQSNSDNETFIAAIKSCIVEHGYSESLSEMMTDIENINQALLALKNDYRLVDLYLNMLDRVDSIYHGKEERDLPAGRNFRLFGSPDDQVINILNHLSRKHGPMIDQIKNAILNKSFKELYLGVASYLFPNPDRKEETPSNNQLYYTLAKLYARYINDILDATKNLNDKEKCFNSMCGAAIQQCRLMIDAIENIKDSNSKNSLKEYCSIITEKLFNLAKNPFCLKSTKRELLDMGYSIQRYGIDNIEEEPIITLFVHEVRSRYINANNNNNNSMIDTNALSDIFRNVVEESGLSPDQKQTILDLYTPIIPRILTGATLDNIKNPKDSENELCATDESDSHRTSPGSTPPSSPEKKNP